MFPFLLYKLYKKLESEIILPAKFINHSKNLKKKYIHFFEFVYFMMCVFHDGFLLPEISVLKKKNLKVYYKKFNFQSKHNF